jgi:toxin ParE1/3/4
VRIVFTRRYLRELASIGDYIGERNRARQPALCMRSTRRPPGCYRTILLSGAPVKSSARELVIVSTPYVVAYRVTENQVEVLFVQHGAQEWPGEV